MMISTFLFTRSDPANLNNHLSRFAAVTADDPASWRPIHRISLKRGRIRSELGGVGSARGTQKIRI
jgi:hypothetical protein